MLTVIKLTVLSMQIDKRLSFKQLDCKSFIGEKWRKDYERQSAGYGRVDHNRPTTGNPGKLCRRHYGAGLVIVSIFPPKSADKPSGYL
jgi:hypothetical protein